MDSVVPDIMQSFNKLSESSLKLAVDSIKEISENASPSTTTTTTTATTTTRNQLLSVIESSIWDESYNWLKQISAGESISKFLNCKIEELPNVLKSKNSIKSYLESLQIDQIKDIFVHLSLENLETKDFTKEDMISKIEEEMMMQGIFKLLFRLDKKTLESFSQDLKIKFNENIAAVCDLIMSTMYDLEESPEIPQQAASPPTTTTTAATVTTATTTASSTSSPVKDNNNNNETSTTSPTNNNNTSEKKETPTKSKKGTPMKAPTKKQPGTPNGTTTISPPSTTTTTATSASPSKNSSNTNTVQSSTNISPTLSSGTGADSNTTTTTTNNSNNKKKVRSSLDKPSSDLPLTPSLPGKRERKPVPIDPLLQTQLSKSNSPPTTNTKSTTKTAPTQPKTTTKKAAATSSKTKTTKKATEPKRKREDDEEDEEIDGDDIYNNTEDIEEEDVDDEELLSITNNNNNNYNDNSLGGSNIEYSNGEPRGYYEDEGKKKWVCPPLKYIKKGVERQYLQNEFNLSDLIEFCKLHNLPKNKTKSKTIKIICDYTENGIIPQQSGSKKKKKGGVKKLKETTETSKETTTATTN